MNKLQQILDDDKPIWKYDKNPTESMDKLEDFIGYKGGWGYCGRSNTTTQSLNPYPCPECNGSQLIYDPTDPPDVIEGNKMRRVIDCPKCTKSNDSWQFKKYWEDQYIQSYKYHLEEMDEWRERAFLFEELIRNMTSDEINAIRYYIDELPFGYPS
jgi:hypothetical protein